MFGGSFFGEGLYYGPNNKAPSGLDFWCPEGALDPESSDIADLGDFEEPDAPTFASQKAFVDIAYDPRNGSLIRMAGGWGAFGEDPDTAMTVYVSTDCGRTWTQLRILDTPSFYGFGFDSDPGVPIQMIPGANEGEWLLFDWWGGYYFTDDNWTTQSARLYSGINNGFQMIGGQAYYLGLIGTLFWNNTRQISVHHYLDAQQIGYTYVIPFRATDNPVVLFVNEFIGIRRSIGVNGTGGWEDSLAPGLIADGGSGWRASETYPAMHGANGRWIVCVDYLATQGAPADTPPMRINTNSDLGSDSWESPFWPVSEAWFTDVYQGTKTPGSYGVGRVEFYPNPHGKILFLPDGTHPAGGRWWMFGSQDMLIYSDDNGDTWSNSLSNHTGPETAMHPILNWRASHSLTTGFPGQTSRPKITDIMQNPHNAKQLIAIGVTWDRPGITNRFAVFSCSVDGGNTWGSVGQLALRKSAASAADNEGEESPFIGRYIFPCVQP